MRASTVPVVEGGEVQKLRDILVRAEEGIANGLKTKGQSCRVEVPEGVPDVRVHGEAATCLFLSLLQNAVRFAPEGSEIEVSVEVDEDAGRVITRVRDCGPGIPLEDRDKICEPFFTTAVDGLGMGLFVAARIADLQSISLDVESSGSGGTTFRVGLPIARPEAEGGGDGARGASEDIAKAALR